mgnify:CR=1 FL=1
MNTTEEENYKLKKALDVLFHMLASGRSLIDIQMASNKIKAEVGWPYEDAFTDDSDAEAGTIGMEGEVNEDE